MLKIWKHWRLKFVLNYPIVFKTIGLSFVDVLPMKNIDLVSESNLSISGTLTLSDLIALAIFSNRNLVNKSYVLYITHPNFDILALAVEKWYRITTRSANFTTIMVYNKTMKITEVHWIIIKQWKELKYIESKSNTLHNTYHNKYFIISLKNRINLDMLTTILHII